MTNKVNHIAHIENLSGWRLLLAASVLAVAGCGVDSSDGDVVNTIDLPIDDTQPFDFECADMGIGTETCVLDDPDNPYARAAVGEESKFELDADAPSATARFYLWATALATGAGAPGENQFYVALNLHRMWASSNSELTRLQALRAYRAYLDNHFESSSFFEIPEDSGNFVPQDVNTWVGELLFDPADISNTFTSTRLFNADPDANKFEASIEVGSWGYIYDQDTETFTRF